MKKTNILFMIWGIIVVCVIILLTVLGFMLKNINKDYKLVEDRLKEAAEKYTSDNFIYPEEGKSLIVIKEKLIDEGYLKDLKLKDDVCDGYVIVETKGIVNYKAFIKCNKYTSKHYEKN